HQWQHIAQVVELGFTLLDSKQAFFDHLCLGFKNKAAIFSWQGFFEVPECRMVSERLYCTNVNSLSKKILTNTAYKDHPGYSLIRLCHRTSVAFQSGTNQPPPWYNI
ncbi:hypothetical protein, partial [Methylocaldum sp.]|uniref:hypothetical protein n=1 Tax=Methylocaldum sp. TaxID=1969727 RepID=UPI002D3266E8